MKLNRFSSPVRCERQTQHARQSSSFRSGNRHRRRTGSPREDEDLGASIPRRLHQTHVLFSRLQVAGAKETRNKAHHIHLLSQGTGPYINPTRETLMALGWKQKILNVETSSPPPASLRKMLSARTDVANCLRFVNPGAYQTNRDERVSRRPTTHVCMCACASSERRKPSAASNTINLATTMKAVPTETTNRGSSWAVPQNQKRRLCVYAQQES